MDDRHRMERAPWVPWAITSVLLVLVAIAAYAFGMQHQAATATVDAGRLQRAWFFGAPFFFFGPFWGIFFFWFVFAGLRRLWWGGYYRPWRYGRYHPYDAYEDDRDWEERHRRAHDRMNAQPAADPDRT